MKEETTFLLHRGVWDVEKERVVFFFRRGEDEVLQVPQEREKGMRKNVSSFVG